MAEVALAGTGGTVYLPGTPFQPITSIHTWTCTIEADNYECTVMGDAWKHYIPGLRAWNGAINGYYNIPLDPQGQGALYSALLHGNQIVVVMQTKMGGGQFEGTANVTRVAVSDPVNNVITTDFTYVGSGSLQHVDGVA